MNDLEREYFSRMAILLTPEHYRQLLTEFQRAQNVGAWDLGGALKKATAWVDNVASSYLTAAQRYQEIKAVNDAIKSGQTLPQVISAPIGAGGAAVNVPTSPSAAFVTQNSGALLLLGGAALVLILALRK